MKAILPFTSLLYLLIGHAECSRRLGGMDDPSDNYLTAITYRYGVQVPVLSTCGGLMGSSSSRITEECNKSMTLDGYLPAKDACPHTCSGSSGGGVVVVDHNGDNGDPEECLEETICEKGSTEMKFKVIDATCAESDNTQGDKFYYSTDAGLSFPLYINLSAKGDVYYQGMVDRGEIITLGNGGNKFAADTDVVVKSSPTGTTYQSFSFHTSCSRNLFIGDSFCAIQLLEFTNSEQGTVSCVPPCVDEMGEFLWKMSADGDPVFRTCEWLSNRIECEINGICTSDPVPGYTHAKDLCPETCQECPVDDDCVNERCTDRPTTMTFKVTGGDCGATTHNQEGKFECTDNSDITYPATVIMKSAKRGDEYYRGTVYEGDVIVASNDGDEFDADMTVEIKSGSHVKQEMTIHSSCSKKLFVGDMFGGVKLISFTNDYQGTVEECTPPEPPNREPCKDECAPPYNFEEPYSEDDLDRLEFCCVELVNEDERPDKDLCCSALVDDPPGYCIPSEVPSAAPSSCSDLCDIEEQGDFRFLHSFDKIDGFDIPIVKSCKWLAMKPKFRRDIICSSTESYLGYKPARQVCTTTCNLCPCSHIPSEVPTPIPSKTPTYPPTAIPSLMVTPDEGCVPCDPYTDPECPFECPHDVCEERPQEFYFRFSGGSCDDSNNSQDYGKFSCNDIGTIVPSRSHYLVFTSAKSDAEVYFEDWVDPGEVVTLTHTGKFQADMRVDVYAGRKIWLQQSLVYHSSCSQNLFNGDIFGAVTLMGFKSYYQNSKCTPINCVEPDCDPDTDPDCPQPPCDREICEVRPDQFFFKLTGGSCSESVNEQPSKFYCNEMGRYDNTKGKYVEFTDTSGYEVYYKGFAAPNQVVTLVPESGRFPADMMIQVYTSANKLYKLQDIQYHSSCSKNLFNGDSFGAVTLVGFKSYYQDIKCF